MSDEKWSGENAVPAAERDDDIMRCRGVRR